MNEGTGRKMGDNIERERERALQTKPYFYNCVTFEEGEEDLGILEGDEEQQQQQQVQLFYMV
jgi:hypothetical protein